MNKYQKAMKIYSCLEHEDTVGNFTPLDYKKARLILQELVDNYSKLMKAFDDGEILIKQDNINGIGIFECEADVWATIGDPIVRLER